MSDDLGFTWNQPKKVQKQSPERVISTEVMSSKQIVQNPNRVSLEQIVAALCVCVGELCEVVEAQAKAERSKLEVMGKSLRSTTTKTSEGDTHGREEPRTARATRKRPESTEPSA